MAARVITCGRCGEEGHNRLQCKHPNPKPQPSRQLRWQRKQRTQGRCTNCGTDNPNPTRLCPECFERKRV